VPRSGGQAPPKRLKVGALGGVLDQCLELSLGANAAKPLRNSVRNRTKTGLENVKDGFLPGSLSVFSDDLFEKRRLDQ
jgi:hypothetical protein